MIFTGEVFLDAPTIMTAIAALIATPASRGSIRDPGARMHAAPHLYIAATVG